MFLNMFETTTFFPPWSQLARSVSSNVVNDFGECNQKTNKDKLVYLLILQENPTT